MFLKNLDIILCLVAGLAVTVVGIITGRELSDVLAFLLIALIIFYVLGLAIKIYLQTKVFPQIEEDEEIDLSLFDKFDDEDVDLDEVEVAMQSIPLGDDAVDMFDDMPSDEQAAAVASFLNADKAK